MLLHWGHLELLELLRTLYMGEWASFVFFPSSPSSISPCSKSYGQEDSHTHLSLNHQTSLSHGIQHGALSQSLACRYRHTQPPAQHKTICQFRTLSQFCTEVSTMWERIGRFSCNNLDMATHLVWMAASVPAANANSSISKGRRRSKFFTACMSVSTCLRCDT